MSYQDPYFMCYSLLLSYNYLLVLTADDSSIPVRYKKATIYFKNCICVVVFPLSKPLFALKGLEHWKS